MRHSRNLLALLAGLVSFSVMSQTSQGRPRLVVGIMVDQLQEEYLDLLRPLFGEGGFRRLMDQGVYLKDIDFGTTGTDRAGGTAQILTGNYPALTGITTGRRFDPATRRSVNLLEGQQGYSPENLQLSTLADEIAIDGIGLGGIYSVAAAPEMAVLMGGHSASSAVWIDDATGRWTTSDYYPEKTLSPAVRNFRTPPAARADTMHWKPMLPLQSYPGLPQQKKFYPFRYTFSGRGADAWRKFGASPAGNREVTDVAVEWLQGLRLGNRGEAIDMLNVAYDLSPWKDVKDGDYRLELQDAYLRLDRDLSRLFAALDKNVGLQNTIVYLLPTGTFDNSAPNDPKYRIPGGDLSTKKAVSLLNAYLTANYGNADYVDGVSEGQIYLNKKALAGKRNTEGTIISEARDFLARMSGVANIYTLADILDSSTEETERLRHSINPAQAGDLLIQVLPGWNLVDDYNYPVQKRTMRLAPAVTPGFILAPGRLEQQVVGTTVDAVAIPSTLSKVLRIRAPNGAFSRPLPLK